MKQLNIEWLEILGHLLKKKKKDYKPMRVGNFWNNYIEYKNSGDRDKNLSVKEYLDRIKP